MPLPFEWTSLVLIAKEHKADVHMRVRPGAILEADKIIQALVAENLRLNREAYTWWEAACVRGVPVSRERANDRPDACAWKQRGFTDCGANPAAWCGHCPKRNAGATVDHGGEQ